MRKFGGKHQDRNGRRYLCKRSQIEEAEESGKTAAEVRGPETRGSPERRDVVEFCLQARVTKYTVTLCVSSSEFVMGYHRKAIIKQYLHHCRELVHFSGSQFVKLKTTILPSVV